MEVVASALALPLSLSILGRDIASRLRLCSCGDDKDKDDVEDEGGETAVTGNGVDFEEVASVVTSTLVECKALLIDTTGVSTVRIATKISNRTGE